MKRNPEEKHEKELPPDYIIKEVEFKSILAIKEIQALMDDFYSFTNMGISINDLKGNVIISTGGQDICTRFHRINRESCRNCIESDLDLIRNIKPGSYSVYKCKNNMWDAVTPIIIGNKHMGNLFFGQFLFDDEIVDDKAFSDQADKFGFDKKEYLAALDKVPRLSRDRFKILMDFYSKLAQTISNLSFSKLSLTKALSDYKLSEETLHIKDFALQSSISSIVFADMKGKITYVNDAFIKLFGYSGEDEVLGRHISEFAVSKEQIKDIVSTLYSGEGYVGEGYALRKDGTTFIAQLSANFITAPDKKPIYMMASLIDISERKKVEDALKKSEVKLRSTLDATPFPVALVDLNYDTIYYWSKSAIDLFGYASPSTTSEWYQLAYPDPDYRQEVINRWKPFLEKARLTGKVTNAGEYRITCRDGSVRICELYANFFEELLIVTFNNITERKKAEEIMLESDEKYHTLFDTSIEGILITEVKTLKFKYANPAICKMLGYTEEELTAMGIANIHPKEAFQVILHGLQSKVMPSLVEIQCLRKDGAIILTEISGSLITIGGKKYNVGFFRDITEKKKAEEKLKNTQILLKASIESPKNMVILAIDKDYNYLFFNHVYKDAIARLYGKEVKIGMNSLDCITLKADRANAKTGYDRALNGEVNSAIQEYGEKERSFYETFYNPIFNENNKIIGVAVFSRDIAERISKEKALKESEQKYRQLFNNMTLGFGLHEMIYDKKGNAADYRFLEVNPAFEKLTGLKASAILGKTVKKVLPDAEQYWVDNYSKVFQNNRQVIFENYSKNLKKWYDVRAFKAGGNKFAVLFSDITEQKQIILRLQNILNDTTKAFSSIIEVKDPYTSGHQERVAKLSEAIAKELKLDEKIISAIKTAALLHDLGKIAIPSSILSKPSKLTNLEFEMIKEHPQIGYEVLKDVDYDYPIAKIVFQHHEKNNGSGYPEGIKDKDIMLEAKIIAIADTVEAMSSHRPYRPAIGISEALKEIDNNKGLLYDTDAVDACLKLFRSKNFKF